LHDVLATAFHHTDYTDMFLSDLNDLTESSPGLEWYKAHYQECVEGFLSLILYFSIHNKERQAALLDLASTTARELNPLALQSGLSTWPLFGLLDQLHLIWQSGERAVPLATEPWHLPPCDAPVPGVISPLLAALHVGTPDVSPFSLVRGLRPGALVVDAGVFDGTDWSLFSVLAGAIVLGFEPLATNRALIEERFPPALESLRPGATLDPEGRRCRRHTLLPVAPGEGAPRLAWGDVFPPRPVGEEPRACERLPGEAPGHTFVIGAALGERVRGLNMTTRFDYSSVADQGYLKGPKDMRNEEVAMTTLDEVFFGYLAESGRSPSPGIDVLKVDVEGYEMGALRGAEQLLASGRVHYLVLEFHPGMLGSTGTDPLGLLEFLRHYCFLCHSLKIHRPYSLRDFVARYTSSREVLPVQGLGAIEDLVCQNLAWEPPPPLPPRQRRALE